MAELLVEIGFEEMPAPWLPGLAEQLRKHFVDAAAREFLEAKDATVAWTPRRLVLRADLPASQADRQEPVWGPALKMAKDSAGAWTAAAQGFAKKSGVAVEALQQKPKDASKPGELNLLFVKQVAGRATRELVPGLLSGLLRGLAFPKRMSWDAWLEDGRGAFPFGRPIRWLVLLFDGKPVPFSIYSLEAGAKGALLVESGAATRGHRFLPKGRGQERPAVGSYAELRDTLRERFVLVEPEARSARIDEGLIKAAVGRAFDDHGLRHEWRDLVEYPTVLVGQVPEEFSSLPTEVLETVLVHHQKYISLDAGGRIDRFAAVINGDGAAGAEIVQGMERVVVARLRDASFFLREDEKRPLDERVADLAGVTFQPGPRVRQGQVGAHGRARGGDGPARPAGGGVAGGGQGSRAARQGGPRHAHGPRVPGAAGRDGGTYPGGKRRGARGGDGRAPPLTTRSRSSRTCEPAAAFRKGRRRRVSRRWRSPTSSTRWRVLRLGRQPDRGRDPGRAAPARRAALDFWGRRRASGRPTSQALVADAGRATERLKQPADATAKSVAAFLLTGSRTCHSGGFAADEVVAVVETPGGPRRPDRRPAPGRGAARARERPRLRGAGRGVQACEEHRAQAGSRRARRPGSCSTPTPSAGSTRPLRLAAGRAAAHEVSACTASPVFARRSRASSTTCR